MTDSSAAKLSEKLTLEDGEIPVVDVAARGFGIRHVQAIVMGVAACSAYSVRTTLSIAIVAMTYDWDEKTQGFVLSSFFWGYSVMQLPCGIITDRSGGHRFLCLAIFGSSFLTFILPQCVYLGAYLGDWHWLFACLNRMCQGLIQAFAYPSIFALLGVWSPPSEIASLSGISLGGALLGTVVATPISGFLAVAYGWPYIFYFFGAAGMVVGLIVFFFGADSPAKHRMISDAEKNYIQSVLCGKKGKKNVPWKKLFTSVPVMATVMCQGLLNCVFLTLFTKIPTYLHTVLNYEMKNNGILSALPYFVSWVLSFFYCWLCEYIVDRGWMKLGVARKVFNSIGLVGSATFLVLMSYASSSAMAIFLLTCYFGIQTAVFPGVQANFVDVVPNYCGTVFSIANSVSALLGIVGPISVGLIVTEAGSVEQWRIVLFLAAAILCLGNIIFVIWSTSETQPWNWPEEEKVIGKGDTVWGSEHVNQATQNPKWIEVKDLTQSVGIAVEKDWTYVRDTIWVNWRKRTIENKHNASRTGTGGGTSAKYTEMDHLDILGKDNPVVVGLRQADSLNVVPQAPPTDEDESKPWQDCNVGTSNEISRIDEPSVTKTT